MVKKMDKEKRDKLGKEMKEDSPEILAKNKQKYGTKKAEKQRKASLSSKARRNKAPRGKRAY